MWSLNATKCYAAEFHLYHCVGAWLHPPHRNKLKRRSYGLRYLWLVKRNWIEVYMKTHEADCPDSSCHAAPTVLCCGPLAKLRFLSLSPYLNAQLHLIFNLSRVGWCFFSLLDKSDLIEQQALYCMMCCEFGIFDINFLPICRCPNA